MIHHEWRDQRGYAVFLSKALPPDAYWTAIDIGTAGSVRGGQLRKSRGQKAGIPDMLIVWHGVTLWMEFKAGSSLSGPQERTRDALRANGHLWELARSLEDVEAACRAAGIPLKATLGEIRTRIAEQDVVPKKRGPAKRKPEPRYTFSKAATKRAAGKGVLV